MDREFEKEQQRRVQHTEIWNTIDRARRHYEMVVETTNAAEEEASLHALRHALSQAMELASKRVQTIRPPFVVGKFFTDPFKVKPGHVIKLHPGSSIFDLIDIDAFKKLLDSINEAQQDEEERE